MEAVRIGTVTAHDKRAYARWRNRPRAFLASQKARGRGGLTGAALEQAVRALASTHPQYVVVN